VSAVAVCIVKQRGNSCENNKVIAAREVLLLQRYLHCEQNASCKDRRTLYIELCFRTIFFVK